MTREADIEAILMRSDFYSLPWAAQQAIQRGEHDAAVARRRAMDISDLRAKVDELEKRHISLWNMYALALAAALLGCVSNSASAHHRDVIPRSDTVGVGMEGENRALRPSKVVQIAHIPEDIESTPVNLLQSRVSGDRAAPPMAQRGALSGGEGQSPIERRFIMGLDYGLSGIFQVGKGWLEYIDLSSNDSRVHKNASCESLPGVFEDYVGPYFVSGAELGMVLVLNWFKENNVFAGNPSAASFAGDVRAFFGVVSGLFREVGGGDGSEQRQETERRAPCFDACLDGSVNSAALTGYRRTSVLYEIVSGFAMLFLCLCAGISLGLSLRQREQVDFRWLATSAACAVGSGLFLIAAITGKIWLFGL